MRLYRVEEVATVLGLKPATIRKMIFRREIPVVRPTRRAVRIREEDIEAIVRLGFRPTAPLLSEGMGTKGEDQGRGR